MSLLNEIVGRVTEKGCCTEDWRTLRLCFRDDNAIKEVAAWAESQGIFATFDYDEEDFSSAKVRSVTFLPKN